LAEERVIKTQHDADFGPLELVEVHTEAAVGGGPMRPLVYRSWRRPHDAEGPELLISTAADPLVIDEGVRATYRAVTANENDLKQQVARDQLDLALEWAASGELKLALNAQTFASLLQVAGYTIDPQRLTVWLIEDAGIFAGHSIEVRFEDGAIAEIGLAG
jgi:hypothetical protein